MFQPASPITSFRLILFVLTVLAYLSGTQFACAALARSFTYTDQRTFSFKQVRNPKWKPSNISTTVLYAASFLKNKSPMPSALASAWHQIQTRGYEGSSITGRGIGQTTSTTGGEFVFPLQIGTPKQNFSIIFDTGSGDFWVWSMLMPAYILQNRGFYNASNSTTAEKWEGQSFGAAYGAGSTYGLVWQDTVWVDNISVAGNPVECAQNLGQFFVDLPGVDGILGLSNAYNDSERPIPQQTWLAYVLPKIVAPVFTVALTQNGPGTIDFGFIDTAKYTGRIAYSPVTIIPGTTGGFWAFNWTGFAIGNSKFNRTNIQVMTDTGGNIVNLPKSITIKYYAQVAGAYLQADGAWAFPCKSPLPDFIFGVGESRIVVTGKHLIFNPLADGVNCYGSIQATQENGYVYMTIPFMESIFIVHDYGAMRLGFANRTT